jgi:phage terminase large subunit
VLTSDADIVVQIGGRFSGKSHNEQIRLIANLASKENYKLLIIEDLETGMAEGFHSGLYARIRDFGHEQAYSTESKVAHIRNEINGNTAIFRGFSTEQQKLNVKKLTGITEILVEEGEWMTFDDLMALYQQLRGGKKEDRRLTVLMNPVNPNCFANEFLIEATPDKVIEYFEDEPNRPKIFEKSFVTKFIYEKNEITEQLKVLVVLTTHHDNSYLSLEQRASIEQYKDTDPEKYEQLGKAKFIRPSGTYFKEFRTQTHVIEPFEIPKHWVRAYVNDYGLDMLAGYWVAFDEEYNAYCYRELYKSDLIVSDASKAIKEYEGSDKITLRYAPPDLYNRNRDTGRSTIDIMGDNGLYFIKSMNDRISGWYNLKEWLKIVKTKCSQTGKIVMKPRLQIFNTCPNIIRTLPQLQRCKKNWNDVDSTTNHELTHGPDALRYLFADRPPRTETPVIYDDDDDDNKAVNNFFE